MHKPTIELPHWPILNLNQLDLKQVMDFKSSYDIYTLIHGYAVTWL